jgi:hypothetical protein
VARAAHAFIKTRSEYRPGCEWSFGDAIKPYDRSDISGFAY